MFQQTPQHDSLLTRATQLLHSEDHEAALLALANLVVPGVADWCTVHVLDGEDLRLVAIAHLDPQRVDWARELSLRYPPSPTSDRGIFHVVRTGESEIHADITDDVLAAIARDPDHLEALKSVGMRHVMIVPLKAGSRVLGAISFISSKPERAYDNSALAQACDLGRLAGSAVDYALLYRSARDAERRMTLIAEASAVLLQEASSAEIVPKTLDLAARVLASDGIAVWLKRPEDGQWTVATSRGLSQEYIRTAVPQLSTDGEALMLRDRPAVAEDVESAPWLAGHLPAHRAEGTCSLIVAPLAQGGSLLGTIAYYYKSPRRFTETEIGAAQAFANLAAAAIHASRLYESEQTARLHAESELAKRNRAEEKLRLHERDLTDLVENATVGIHWVGSDGRIQWANQSELEMMGCTADEYFGRHIAEFHADEGAIDDILERLSRGEALHEYPARLRCRSGDIKHVTINSSAYFRDGEFVHTRCFTRDVTAQVEAARALQASEARYRRIVGAIQEGMLVLDRELRTTFANPHVAAMLGYMEAEMVGCPLSDFMDEISLNSFEQELRRGGGRVSGIDCRLRHKRGSDLWALVSATPVQDEQGGPGGAMALMTDITDRKRWEIEQARLAAIVDTSEDAIVSKDLNGIVTSWNRAAERVYGWPAIEIIGKSKALVIPPDLPNELPEILRRISAGERIDHYETARIRKDGVRFDVSISVSPLKDGQGRIVGASTIARDITERKRTERELRQKQDEVEALNRRLKRAMQETHHRVKNNLQVIAAMVDLQTMERGSDRMIPVEELTRLATHVSTLATVHDVLTRHLREDEEDQLLHVDSVFDRLIPLLEQTAAPRPFSARVAGINVTSKQATGLALVANELVSNAVKHGKGAVSLTIDSHGGMAMLTVCDEGPGFPRGFDAITAANTGLDLVSSMVSTDLAGCVSFTNRPAGGAMVRVEFPLPLHRAADGSENLEPNAAAETA